MAHGDGAAIDVDLLLGHAQVLHELEHHGGEGLVDLEQVDVADFQAGLGQGLAGGRRRAGLEIGDIDLFEVNEAFASVVLKFMKDLCVPEEKVNVNGGAIAMGHPLGATGCIILATLLDELERRQQRYGLATLCVGGGMGIATIIERV